MGGTPSTADVERVDVYKRQDQNYGLGGSHKVAFGYAAAHGYEHLVVLHGDDQGAIVDLLPILDVYKRQGLHRVRAERGFDAVQLLFDNPPPDVHLHPAGLPLHPD